VGPPFVAFLALCGCDGGIYVRGVVRDPSGGAIPKARVSILEVGRDQATDEEGCFNVGGLTAPGRRDYSLTVSAPGYKLATAKLRSGKDPLAVTLQPEGSAGESAVRPLTKDPCEGRAR